MLTTDPGTGVMRHADAGYERAVEVARERGVRIPMLDRRDADERPTARSRGPLLARASRQGASTRRRSLLTGPPGAGKTTLLLRAGDGAGARRAGCPSTST